MITETNAEDSWRQALMPQFLDMTASRQIELDIERGNLETGTDPLAAIREIGRIAHKISGTAASFGFVALGKQSQIIEIICCAISKESGPSLADAVSRRLRPALDTLMHELDFALVSPR